MTNFLKYVGRLLLIGVFLGTLVGFGSSLEFVVNPSLLVNSIGLNSFQCRRAKYKDACFSLESHSRMY